MSDEDTDPDAEAYDPTEPSPPACAPPNRTTAPQSEFTIQQVGVGFLVLFVVLLLLIGLTVGLA